MTAVSAASVEKTHFTTAITHNILYAITGIYLQGKIDGDVDVATKFELHNFAYLGLDNPNISGLNCA